MSKCDYCGIHACAKGEPDKYPQDCPSRNEELQEKSKTLYQEEENHKIAYHSAMLNTYGREQKTRVEEIIEFLKACGYKHIGVPFCYGLRKEAKIFTKLLRERDFQVTAIICKNCGLGNDVLGIDSSNPKVDKKSLCNPIGQALFLNQMKTEFNVLLGLCVGHDTLFMKYSEAPSTVLAVKDRVTGHNPLVPLYLEDSFYRPILHEKKKEEKPESKKM